MTTPALAGARLLRAMVMGAALGFLYGFLRPLRPKRTLLCDLLFLIAAFRGWLFHAFRICAGDFRFSYFLGALAAGICFDRAAGKLLYPLFSIFWQGIGKICGILSFPVKKILTLLKKMFASGEKWVTIGWNNRRHMTRKLGGKPYGRTKRIFQPDQAGSDAYPQPGEDRSDPGHRIVYGCADRPSGLRQ